MNRYIYRIEAQPKADMHVTVLAETKSAANRIIDKILRESNKRVHNTGQFGPDFLVADFIFQPAPPQGTGAVPDGKEEINGQDLESAHRFLKTEGYNYQGDDETLAADEQPLFVKDLWTADGAGIDTHLRVWAVYDLYTTRYNFQVEAMLFPTGRLDLEMDNASYSVQFRDKQLSITMENLPRALTHYASKFTELVTLLYRANSVNSKRV